MSYPEDEGEVLAPPEVIRTLETFGEHWPPWLFLLAHRFDDLVSPETDIWLKAHEAPAKVIEFARLAREAGPHPARDWVINGLVEDSHSQLQPLRLYAVRQLIEGLLVLETWEPLTDDLWLAAVRDYREDAALYYEPAKPLEFFLQMEELYGARAPVQDRVELMLAIGELFLWMPPEGRWDRAQMVEESIRILAEAIEETDRAVPKYTDARLHAVLGSAYLQRMDADPIQHLVDAKHHLRVALEMGGTGDGRPSEVVAAMNELVQCCCEIGRLSFDPDERQRSLREALNLIETTNWDGQRDLTVLRPYVFALMGEFDADSTSKALAEMDGVLTATVGGKPGGVYASDEWYAHARETNVWAWARFRYAQICLMARARGHAVDLQRAIEGLEGEVANMFDQVSVGGVSAGGSELIGDLRAFEGDWHGALTAYARVEEMTGYVPHTIAGREAAARQGATLGAKKAVCLTHLGDTLGALVASEQYKAGGLLTDLLLTELSAEWKPEGQHSTGVGSGLIAFRTAVDGLREAEARARLPRQSPLRPSDAELGHTLSECREKVVALAEDMGVRLDEVGRARVSDLSVIEQSGATVAAVIVAPFGGVVLAARAGPAGTATKWYEVPVVNTSARDLIGSYVRLLQNLATGTMATLDKTIEDLLEHMDECFGSALRSALEDVLTPAGGRISILANEGLSVLPWQALTDRNTSASLGATYAVASWPSLRWASNMAARPAHARLRRLLVVADATRDLPFAGVEGALIAVLARSAGVETTLLTRRKATASRLIELLPSATHLHIASHAWADVSVPWRSSVRLADGDISAASLFVRISGDLQLATLSGCETGVSEMGRSPQERTGLTAAFLGGGCRAVVSSVWPMDDLSSCILMAESYRRLLVEGQPVEEAIRGAAEWLRTATRDDILRWLDDQRSDVRSWRLRVTLWTARWRVRRGKGDGPPPFGSPFYWAGFGVIAAPLAE